MGRRRRLLIALFGAVVLLTASTGGQSTQPISRTELPDAVVEALSNVADHSLQFDQPGFYALVRHLRTTNLPPGHVTPPTRIDDWNDFVARPGSLRGRPVTLSGIVGRNKDRWRVPGQPELGSLGQIELHQPGQPIACTLITTGFVDDIPVGATIETTGYFVMVRKYLDRNERPHLAALIVTPGITTVTQYRSTSTNPMVVLGGLGGAILLGVVVTVVLLRRSGSLPRGDPRDVHASRPAPLDLSSDLADWAASHDESNHHDS